MLWTPLNEGMVHNLQPKLRVEAIVWRKLRVQTQFLVQCDDNESFYRFPGGTVEFGETGAAALQREFNEEYDLEVRVGKLKVVSEERATYDGNTYHRVTLLYEADISPNDDGEIRHKEYADVKMVWRSLDELARREVAPTGIFEYLKNFQSNMTVHLVHGFS